MSHFYGIVQSNRGEATRGGSKDNGLSTTAASWQGSIRVHLWHNEETGLDMALVQMAPWYGGGMSGQLYRGPVEGSEAVEKRSSL